jgi:outer membrane protein assembly factor BamB
VGGLSVAENRIIVSGRDVSDLKDQFVALDAQSGRRLWTYQYEAPAELDYGNTPRATPVIAENVVVTLGATGILSAIDLKTGVKLWTLDLAKQYSLPIPTWGFCGTPLVHEQTIYLQVAVNPTLIAVDLFDGSIQWEVDGNEAAYSSLVLSTDGKSLFGVDSEGYFERRLKDGSIQWSAKRPYSGDFGVPAPIVLNRGVAFIGENNGLAFRSNDSDELVPIDEDLLPDSHTPVGLGSDVLIAFEGLHRVSTEGKNRVWSASPELAEGYVALIASDERLIAFDQAGKIVLADCQTGKILDQAKLAEEKLRTLSHPAIVGTTLWIRAGRELRSYEMSSRD